MTDTTKPAGGRLPLNTRQIVLCVIIGVVLWFVAAMLIRILGPMGVHEGSNRILLYILIWPGTYPFLLASQKIAGLARDQIVIGIALMTAAATLCDGVALAWFPTLYGAGVQHFANAGATILWGAGVGLIISCFMNRVEPR